MESKQRNYFSKSRIEAFSDAIFAIIVTLLVLEIKVPEIEDKNSVEELTQALLALLPKILSWMISFLIVCVVWKNHHRIFEQVKRVNHSVFWMNANLLLWSSLIPFPTALLGDYFENPVASIAFGAVLALMSLTFSLLRISISSGKGVLQEGTDLKQYRIGTLYSFVFGPVLYALGALSSLIHPYIAFGIYTFIPLYFIFFNPVKSSEDFE